MSNPTEHPYTLVVTAGRPDAPGAALNHGIIPASNFRGGGDHWYARSDGTPTVDAFEEAVGRIEGGAAVAFSTGMAASAAVLALMSPGAAIARTSDVYHGVGELLADGSSRGMWSVETVDPGDLGGWRKAARNADLLWIETPTNPLVEVTDLPEIGAAADRKALIVVDSTFATPLGQAPLLFGADLVVHSATKFIGGHSDLLLGVVVGRTRHRQQLRRHRSIHGAAPGALETFLALRGLRTLALRLERSTANAGDLARRLAGHELVGRVRYPGLPSHPAHDVAARFMKGMGAVLAFELTDDETADRFLAGLRTIVHATSLGGVETTAERRSGYPGSSHLPPGLVRMSVGCEHVEDLWRDIDAALSAASTQS